MKVKDLTVEQKSEFRRELPKFDLFLKEHLKHLATTSLSLYKRTLSYISVINNLQNLNTKDICICLTKKALTNNNLIHIVGDEVTTNNNKNIRLSAFKNLVEIYKPEIKKEISSVAYNSIIEKLGKRGCKIRQNILKDRKNKDIERNPISNLNWDELQCLNKEYLKKFKEIQHQYIKHNEIPDYMILRDCLVCNLYVNNNFKHKSLDFNVLLRNEYKSLYLHIGDHQPPTTNKNYLWVKLESNDSKIIINKNKTTGGVKRCIGTNIGHTKIIPQKDQKIFPLNKDITKIILFIQQVFNERKDRPFIKSNNRISNYTSSTWSKMLTRVFKNIDSKISSTLIRKIYYQKILESDYLLNEKQLIYEMSDFSLTNSVFERVKQEDNIVEEKHTKLLVEENLKMILSCPTLKGEKKIRFL